MYHHPIVIVKGPAFTNGYNACITRFTNKQVWAGTVSALQTIEQNSAYVVVIESELPGISGIELAEAIRDIDDEVIMAERIDG